MTLSSILHQGCTQLRDSVYNRNEETEVCCKSLIITAVNNRLYVSHSAGIKVYLYGLLSDDSVGVWRRTCPGRRYSVAATFLVLLALSTRLSSWSVAAGAGSCRCRTCCSCLDPVSSSCPCRVSCRRVAPWQNTRSATDYVGSSSASLVCSRDSMEICVHVGI